MSSLQSFKFEDPFRPIYEYYPTLVWFAAGILLLLAGMTARLPAAVCNPLALAALTIAGLRGLRVMRLYRVQRSLEGQPITFMTRAELKQICHRRAKENPEPALFLGYGFDWGQPQTQTVHLIKRADPSRVVPVAEEQMGQSWIHGLGMSEEKEVWLPLDHTAGHLLLVGTTRSGKALPMDARIHTPNGWIRMRDVQVGTVVSTPDGGAAKVSGVFPQGALETFHVHFNDGRVVEASGDHLWQIHHKHWHGKYKPGVSRAGKAKPRVLTTLEVRNQILKNKGTFCVPFSRPVAKPHADLPIPPYVLGVLLGDGMLGKGNRLTISSADAEIIGRVAAEIDGEYLLKKVPQGKYEYQIVLASQPGRPKTGRLPGGGYVTHPMRRHLIALGLDECRSWEKFIPPSYLEASLEQRIALLQGLMDTDGTVDKGGAASITSTSEQLMHDMQELIWSLGGRAVLRQRATPTYMHKGERRQGRPAFKLSVELEYTRTAFSLQRKIDRCPDGSRRKFRTGLAVTKIVPARTTECQCIKVDHSEELFITDHYVVTHNTRLLDSVVAQAVDRGEPVVIWDPKGDKGLCDAARKACEAANRRNDFVFFSPAFPQESARIDPLANFSRATELATRVASLIASETDADPFTAFSQKILTNLCEGLLMIHQKPTLVLLKRYVDSGPERLVIKASEAYFSECNPEWRAEAQAFMGKVRRGDEHTMCIALIDFYRATIQKTNPHSGLEGLYADFEHDKSHQVKMTASLSPVLTMLTAGPLAELLSPDPNTADPRAITDFASVILNNQVCYIGLDSLSDNMVGSAIGSMFVADMTAVSGSRYNYSDLDKVKPVNLVIDEAAELVSDKMIQLLNKSGGAKFRIIVATQTFADFAARVGSTEKARQVLGNLNNVIALRIIDADTQEYVADSMPEVPVRHIEYMQATGTSTNDLAHFNYRLTEAMKETEVPLVEPQLFGCLPNLQFFARVSGGHVKKVRSPILVD